MGIFKGRTRWLLLASAMLFAGSACAAGGSAVSIIRDVDAIQVMSPEEVTAMRSTLVPALIKDDAQVETDSSVPDG
ncbi:MAG: hypothetical protein F2581_04975, partial [Actinobacteria bacterium]|nr:hypothetical protein [Actinomycetota bacterium]